MVAASLLALSLFAGCASSEDDSGSASGCGDWCFGGQTGSLVPACGVTPNAISRGVPASAAGIVVSSEPCGDARLFDALTVRDASGQPIPFSAEPLPNGELLIHPQNGFAPGVYTVSVQAGGDDEDAGVESNADAGGPVGATFWQQTVSVEASMPLPQSFGTVGREQYGCRTLLELRPEATVLPYLGLISVDIQVNTGAARTWIATGTMKLENGVTRVELPGDLLGGLLDGEHTLHITVRLAGEAAPLESFMMTLSLPCEGSGDTYYAADEEAGGCSAITPGGATAHESSACGAFVLIAFALRKRRRAAR
jgi:hypothetical protein